MPLGPDIIITNYTIDPTDMAEIAQPIVDWGVTIVAWGASASDWTLGKEQANLSACDYYTLGVQLGNSVCELYPEPTKLGYLHWINSVNSILLREKGFLDALEKCPQITVIADGDVPDPKSTAGFSDPNQTTSYTVDFIAQHPDLNVIFAPWEYPAPGIEAAIKLSGLEGKIDIVTMDLGETSYRQIRDGKTIKLTTGQALYDAGRIMALTGAMAAAGLETPPFTIVPTFPVTKENLDDAWEYMHGPEIKPPAD